VYSQVRACGGCDGPKLVARIGRVGHARDGGQNRQRLAALDTSGNATGWDPNPDMTVRALAASGGAVLAGGSFTRIESDALGHFARPAE
jgi:hypothetical protein